MRDGVREKLETVREGGRDRGRESLTGWIEKVRSGGENYTIIWLKSVKLQSGEER